MATRYLDDAQTEILRRARKDWPCTGNGACGENLRRAPGCTGTIPAGAEHVEYVGEVPAFQSGPRHCMACHREFWPAT